MLTRTTIQQTASTVLQRLPSSPYLKYSAPIFTIGQLSFSSVTTTTTDQPQKKQELKMSKDERKQFLQSHLKITHERSNNRFIVYPTDLNIMYPLDETRRTEEDAHLLYKLSEKDENGKQTVDFTSTYVPPPFRGGTGISEFLVGHGLDWAVSSGYNINPEPGCWYVKKFLPWKGSVPGENKDEKASLAEDKAKL